MAGKIYKASGRLPGDYGPLINQSERAYYRCHIIVYNKLLLQHPSTKTLATLGHRAFVVAAPVLWNNWTVIIRNASTI